MTKTMENKYSKLFLKYVPRTFTHDKKGNSSHPFQFLEDLCNKENKEIIEFRHFNQGFTFYNDLKKKGEHSLNWLIYEYSLIKGSNEYINKIVGSLIKLYKKTNSINKDYLEDARNMKC